MKTHFDAETHTYTIDGKTVPSVTQVLGDLLPCYHADDWYLQRGTAVHACAAMIATDVQFENDPQIDGQVWACKKFFRDANPIVADSEKIVYSSIYRYAGTLDLLCWIDKKLVIIDWKASFSESLPYQLTAYEQALSEYQDRKRIVRYGYGVQLKEDGNYQMSERYDLRMYKNGFLSLLGAYIVRQKCKVQTKGTETK